MFLGWYDPDRRKAATTKLAEAVERYEEKFGVLPEICLTNELEAEALSGKAPLPVRAVNFIPRHTFYVGVDEVAAEATAPVPAPVAAPMAEPIRLESVSPARATKRRAKAA